VSDKNTDWQDELELLYTQLHSDKVCYLPIRHHSPACAWHVREKILELKPASILIEGPESLSSYIKTLAHPEPVAPVALYTHIGAKVAFCDLDYPEQILAEAQQKENKTATSLLREHLLSQNEYLKALAENTDCRDFNEFWDKSFEGSFLDTNGDQFWKEVVTYCYFARINTPKSDLQNDGTLARERRMWELIQSEKKRLKKSDRTLMVITGGFHTPPLALGNIDQKVKLPSHYAKEEDLICAPISYSFKLLDALNGYGAGMPSPEYYQSLWEHPEKDLTKRCEDVTRSFLSLLAHKSREEKLTQILSTADVIAAYQQACLLARFRGNSGPMMVYEAVLSKDL